MEAPISKGTRVVYGRPEKVTVADVVFVPSELRWAIVLDWGPHGVSRVYDHDEGKVWFRYGQAN